jgi:hypothetical protein
VKLQCLSQSSIVCRIAFGKSYELTYFGLPNRAFVSLALPKNKKEYKDIK